MEQSFEIITLDWLKSDYKAFPSTSGVYQIYGTSPLYGMDTLLYIGKAENLQNRINDHFDYIEGVIGRQPNKSCRFAAVENEWLTAVEETLIIMHKPSFNSARLIQVCTKAKKNLIYIQNHGERGMLSLEVTNFYFFNASNLEIRKDHE